MSDALASPNTELKDLAHEAVEELWVARETQLEPTADIDMVWVLSAPGSVSQEPQSYPYENFNFNMNLINEGTRIIRGVTALRLGKAADEVTKEDIERAGPVLFYNGEDSQTAGFSYTQNEDLRALAQQPDFPIPASKLIIDHIDAPFTVPQVVGLAKYLQAHPDAYHKVAVVSAFQHSARVGRYIEQYRDMLPDDVTLLNAPTPQSHNESIIAAGEIKRILRYYQAGHLALNSYFGDAGESRRPDLRHKE